MSLTLFHLLYLKTLKIGTIIYSLTYSVLHAPSGDFAPVSKKVHAFPTSAFPERKGWAHSAAQSEGPLRPGWLRAARGQRLGRPAVVLACTPQFPPGRSLRASLLEGLPGTECRPSSLHLTPHFADPKLRVAPGEFEIASRVAGHSGT